MDTRIDELLEHVEETYSGKLQRGGRHYLEVNLSEQARKMGFADLEKKLRTACAIIPLNAPQKGMKVRIDGRTFVNYAEYDSGMAVPGYLAKTAARKYRNFVPQDSMICNFC
ncbi:hypothetical protein DSCW_60600 [Desulfosarcina widdelii]|uniref:Uncharacterized protein n=1 Tax=Desulfosarcina widdelii TaxID=947919 RepID=A0A5K7ZG03_9BACT|nr:hypothetical protein [Desulfosarcina widdelii]BBO78643.1 hypothetical protein DSCW_60600 [Desulfosarcina widdelii]